MDVKPGLFSSEFWFSIVHMALIVLGAGGIINMADATKLEGALTAAITAVAAFITSAWVVISYIKSRTAAKSVVPAVTVVAAPAAPVILAMPETPRSPLA